MMVVLHVFRQWVIYILALYMSYRKKWSPQMAKLCPEQEQPAKGKEDEIKICTLAQGCAHQRKKSFFLIYINVPCTHWLSTRLYLLEGACFSDFHMGIVWAGSVLLVRPIYKAHGTSIMEKLFIPLLPWYLTHH